MVGVGGRRGLRRVSLSSSCHCVSKEVTCQIPVWTFQRFPKILLGLSGAPAWFCPRLLGFCCALCWSPLAFHMERSLVPTCWAWTPLDPFSSQTCGHLGESATEKLVERRNTRHHTVLWGELCDLPKFPVWVPNPVDVSSSSAYIFQNEIPAP